MTLKLQSHISFTEEEYKSIFYESRTSYLSLRKLVIKKGVILLNDNYGGLTPDVVENFIFNSIIRKTVQLPLFYIYKKLVQTLSYDQVWFYSKSRRNDVCGSGRIEKEYIPGIVNIIFSDSQESDIVCYSFTKYDNTKTIKEWNNIVSEVLASTKNNNELCSCSRKMYWTIRCGCCIKKMTSFANDCIINLGEVIFVREISKFLLFLWGFGLIIDIKYTIGLNFVKIM